MSRKKTKPIPGQLVFEFNIRRAILRKLHTVNDRVKHLLRVLDDHAGDYTDARVFVATIAREMCASKRTAERAIKQAEEEGWIARLPRGRYWRCGVCRNWNRNKFRACGTCESDRPAKATTEYRRFTTYRLLRAAMEHRSGVSRKEDLSDDQPANLADQNRQAGGSEPPNRRIRTAYLAHPKKPSLKPSLKPSPNPTLFDGSNTVPGSNTGGQGEGSLDSQDCPLTPVANTGALGGVTWESVRAALEAFGCRSNTAVETACETARTRGVESHEALAIVEHAALSVAGDVRAWGPGAVLQRLGQHRPGDEIAEFWPNPNPAFLQAEREAERRASRPKSADEIWEESQRNYSPH